MQRKVLSRADYCSLVSTAGNYCDPRDALNRLKIRFPNINRMTLWSIINVNYTNRMKKNAHILKSESFFTTNIYQPYLEAAAAGDSGGMLRISRTVDISPALIAKRILEYTYTNFTSTSTDLPSNASATADMPSSATTITDMPSAQRLPTGVAFTLTNSTDLPSTLAMPTDMPSTTIPTDLPSTPISKDLPADCRVQWSLILLNEYLLKQGIAVHWDIQAFSQFTAYLRISQGTESTSFTGRGSSKKLAKANAAYAALLTLLPTMEDGQLKERITSYLERLDKKGSDGSLASSPPPDGTTIGKKTISKYLQNPHLIPDRVLARNVEVCVANDDQYGPLAMALHTNIGSEYEHLLLRLARESGLQYKDENALRKYGYDKTPDIKLEVPVAVDGQVINWIESKALFGDEGSHKKYLENQLWSYWNRFGPGMVIYWFGYVTELENLTDGIILSDSFPSKIRTML